jgi:hypothetical protein
VLVDTVAVGDGWAPVSPPPQPVSAKRAASAAAGSVLFNFSPFVR